MWLQDKSWLQQLEQSLGDKRPKPATNVGQILVAGVNKWRQVNVSGFRAQAGKKCAKGLGFRVLGFGVLGFRVLGLGWSPGARRSLL